MVEEAVTLDLLDAHTRVTKTNYRLGWPSRSVILLLVLSRGSDRLITRQSP